MQLQPQRFYCKFYCNTSYAIPIILTFIIITTKTPFSPISEYVNVDEVIL